MGRQSTGQFDRDMEEGRIYAVTKQFKDAETRALGDIHALLSQTSAYVALSWGKQSIVLAHLAWRVSPEILCVHWSGQDADIIADFDATRDAFLRYYPINYLECSRGERWLKEAGVQLMQEGGYGGLLIGLASWESKGRRYALGKAGENNIYRYADGRLRCCPIARWGKLELAAYIAKYQLPVLSTYRRLGLDVRTSAGLTPGSHAEAGIDHLPSKDLEEWRRRWSERGEL